MASSSGDVCDDKPLLVFHQCMPTEWKTWGRDSAREMADLGFAVIWVKSCHWRELKDTKPHAFLRPYKAEDTKQEMICTIVMRDITCLKVQDVVQRMREGLLPMDLRHWKNTGFELELPPGDKPCTPDLSIVAVTEASALMNPQVSPRVVRFLYRSYPQRLLWAGFNGPARVTGSKLLVGEPEDFHLLQIVLDRLKVWHIDQQYKSFQNDFFSVVSGKLDILVGYRDHVSGCCDNHDKARKMCGDSWCPKPDIQDIIARKPVPKIQIPAEGDPALAFIVSSLHNFTRCRGPNCPEDTVALRMWSFLEASDEVRDLCSSKIDAHREDMHQVAIQKSAAKTKAVIDIATGQADPELMDQMDRMLQGGEPLPQPVPVVGANDVLMFIKNNGVNRNDATESTILAMCKRGLCVDESGSSLTCRWHNKKQFCNKWGLWQARCHFQTFGYHKGEQAKKTLEDEAATKEGADATLPSPTILPLQLGMKLLQGLGWKPGESLGKIKTTRESSRQEMQAEFSLGGTLMNHGLMQGQGPGMQARVVFQKADTPGAAEPAPEEEGRRPEEEQHPVGEEHKLGEEEQNPATRIDPIDINEIDKFAKALLYLQSIAYGTSEENESLEQWPDEVRYLHEHCSRHADGLRDLGAIVDEIVQHPPGEWITFSGSNEHLRKDLITPMWKGALYSGFISEDLEVQMTWWHCLNRYAVRANLLCKFVVQGIKEQGRPSFLAYQAQGRKASTRYKEVTRKKRLRDGALEAVCTGSSSK